MTASEERVKKIRLQACAQAQAKIGKTIRDRDSAVVAASEAGCSSYEIGRALGMSHAAVLKLLRRAAS